MQQMQNILHLFEEAKVLEASRKLALGEIKEGTKLQDAEASMAVSSILLQLG